MLSLLTLVRGATDSESLLKSATVIQNGFGAELLVAHPEPIAEMPTMIGDSYGYAQPVDIASLARTTERARSAFEKVCGGRSSCHFRETKTSISETLRKQSLFADLCLLSRAHVGDDFSLLKEALVLANIPTVLLPEEPLSESPATIVFSWNGQAPSARAIKAAVPFARKAKRLVVLEHAGNEVNRSRLERFFHNQGMKPADWRRYGERGLTARGRARALLADAKAEGCDLLVMGAYGDGGEHFFRFGRATDKVASSAKIPVLFSS